MRVAIVSDIHGNLIALEAVLTDLDKDPPDAVICLGDVVVTGPQPRQVITRLRALGWPIVMGNTDAWLLDPQPWDATDEDSRRQESIELWGASQMTAEDLAFIRSFKPTISFDLGHDLSLLCYHGSPNANTDFIGPLTPEDELEAKLGRYKATIMAGGHTHQQMLRRHQGSLLINPGSIGMPYQNVDGETQNPLWAEYALVANLSGKMQIEFRRVPVDFERLAAAVHASGMPHAGWWLKDWSNG